MKKRVVHDPPVKLCEGVYLTSETRTVRYVSWIDRVLAWFGLLS